MLNRLLLGFCLLGLAACNSPGPSCYGEDGALDIDLAQTDGWELGALPLWTTPDAVETTYGLPDGSVSVIETPQGARPRTAVFGQPDTTDGPLLSPQFDLIGDTLAYPMFVSLQGRPLRAGADTLYHGDSVRRFGEAFPRSYSCSDSTVVGWPYMDREGGDRVFIVADSVRRAAIAFFFRDDQLQAVGIDGYEGWRRAQL